MASLTKLSSGISLTERLMLRLALIADEALSLSPPPSPGGSPMLWELPEPPASPDGSPEPSPCAELALTFALTLSLAPTPRDSA
jgi:hypothetical protein